MASFQEVRCGDLVFCLFDVPETPRTVGLSRHDGMITGAYTVFESNSLLLSQYFEALYISLDDRKLLGPLYSGLRNTITASRFLGVKTPVPPPAEQAAIVRFLGYADRRIRKYIRSKEKRVALLEEQEQAVVHQAVTGQIDVRTGQPHSAYKDSGIEWLGSVPEHWQRRRLKTMLRVVDRRSSTGAETLLSLRRDHGVVVYAEHFSRPPQGRSLVGYKVVATDQLVVNRLQANNGLVFRSGLDGLVSPDYSIFERTSPVDMRYLSDLLRTTAYRAYFRREATGLGTGTAGFLRLYDDKFLATPVCVPSRAEQARIRDWVGRLAARTSELVKRERQRLGRVEELRSRLIADVVTGKVDIREAAASLPDVDPIAKGGHQEESVGLRAIATGPLSALDDISQPADA